MVMALSAWENGSRDMARTVVGEEWSSYKYGDGLADWLIYGMASGDEMVSMETDWCWRHLVC